MTRRGTKAAAAETDEGESKKSNHVQRILEERKKSAYYSTVRSVHTNTHTCSDVVFGLSP